MPSGLVHITVGHPRRFLMDLLEENSRLMGCCFVPLPRHWSAAKPFTLFEKFGILRNYLSTGEVSLNDIVLFTDAYDVMLSEHADVIVEKFLATGADIVFSGESAFYPSEGRDSIRRQFEISDSKWRYLNSGGYIGYGWAVKKLVDYCAQRLEAGDYELSTGPNDQPIVQEFFLAHRETESCLAFLDTMPEIFACLNTSLDDFVVARSRVRGRRSGRTVSVLHANAGKANLEVLTNYWSLVCGATGTPGQHDLRIATANGQVLGYNAEQKKLVPVGLLDPSVMLLVVKGNRHAIALTAADGILTFTPQGTVHADSSVVNLWEILTVRQAVMSHHERPLESYCNVGDAEHVTCVPPTLFFLLSPSFEVLLDLMRQYAGGV